MKKGIRVALLAIGIGLFTFVYHTPIALAVDGSPLYGGHLCTQHDTGEEIQVCANCHKPHGAKGKKIWARDLSSKGKAVVTKDLCVSCHHRPNNEFSKISSGLTYREKGGTPQWDGIPSKDAHYNNKNGNVFELEKGETERSADHVMGIDAANRVRNKTSLTAEVPSELLHLSEGEGAEGFYCGSCHNPHKQPNKDESGNGDYLRVMTGENAGTTHNRREFCRQCHPGEKDGRVKIHVGDDPQCEACHRPHDGYKYENDDGKERLILIDFLPASIPFQFPKTLGDFNPATQNVYYKSTNCTSCHLDRVPGYNGPPVWEEAPKLGVARGHHPMGRPWEKTSCTTDKCHTINLPDKGLFHLDGYSKTADGKVGDPLPTGDSRRIFGCTSCHGAHTTDGKVENDKFLLYASFKDDATDYCEHCHNSRLKVDGTTETKQTPHPKDKQFLAGKHLRDATSDQRGGCMFCHFIHLRDDNDLGGNARKLSENATPKDVPTDIKALMRIPAKAVDWGTQGTSVKSLGRNGYEAMCYGCHNDPEIVGNYTEDGSGNGSLLNPSGKNFFSHRFACKPESSNTKENFMMGLFPIADGSSGAPGGTMDDYGTEAGQIYCGSCHDVHDNVKPPYLYRLSLDDKATPYKSDSLVNADGSPVTVANQAAREGFCEQCHCTLTNADPMGKDAKITHPVGEKVVPNALKTKAPFTERFYGGGSGSSRGITYGNFKDGKNGGVICLTCHNVHAAKTPWSGKVGSSTLERDLHGFLLVEDNYPGDRPPGGNMCQGCHGTDKF
ncbi:MAG: cytochrome c3 family protein [bacterium]